MVARTPLSRRAALGLLALSAVAACGGDPAPHRRGRRIAYGRDPSTQFGVLSQPPGTARGLMVLLHGGFWSDAYGLDLMDPVAADLLRRGWATWNVEYRRLGGGGGYPTTFTDVAAAVDHTRTFDIAGPRVVIGHSAGGHLAAWAALRRPSTPGGAPAVTADLTVSLSGVLCLASAGVDGVGGAAPTALMGYPFDGTASDYDRADPVRLVPTRRDLIAVHADDDAIVPLSQSSDFVDADRRRHGRARLVTVPGGHFDLIDPDSDAWEAILGLLPGP